MSERGAGVALVAFALAMAVTFAVVAFWTPPQGDDWGQWLWAARHADLGASRWWPRFLVTHATFSELASYALARSTALHVVLSPVVDVALVLGIFVLSARRLPRATSDDVLAIIVASALLWVSGDRIGQTLFHRSYVATEVYGTALAVWVLAAYRCGWRTPRWAIPALVLAGYFIGTSTRAIATGTLVGVLLALRSTPRDRRLSWMRWTFGALVIGTIVGYAKPPWIQVVPFLRYGLETNLIRIDVIVEVTGVPIVAIALLAFVDRVLAACSRDSAPSADAPDVDGSLGWLAAWIALGAWALLGPHYTEAALFPATVCLVVACLPYACWLARGRALRRVITGTALLVNAIAWWHSIAVYRVVGAEARQRFAALARATPGTVAVIAPYSDVMPTSWWHGEDWERANLRQTVAIEAFGLEDIEFSPSFREVEPNPGIEVRLELEGVPEEARRRAAEPTLWGTELSVARHQFELYMDRLRQLGLAPTARLIVANVDLPARGTRPLVAAWADHGVIVAPRVSHFLGDANDRYRVTIRPPGATRFSEAWAVHGGRVDSIAYRNGAMQVQPMRRERYVIVACNPNVCFAADAFIPRL